MKIKECANIIVVTTKEDFEQVSTEINSLSDKRIIVTVGGQTRQESVMQGFKYVKSDILLIS